MVAISASDLLAVWEQAWNAPPTEQALLLLRASHPDLSADELLHAPIGLRDGLLLQLRESLFGHRLTMLVSCPKCQEQIELELSTQQLNLQSGADFNIASNELLIDDFHYQFRVPTSGDLLAIAGLPDSESRRRCLLARCVSIATGRDQSAPVEEISEAAATELMAAMDAADPQANVEIPVCCVGCQHRWLALFDIVSCLWTELDAWARRTLNEIHLLASAYGWSEPLILSLSPIRRQLYVNMVRG